MRPENDYICTRWHLVSHTDSHQTRRHTILQDNLLAWPLLPPCFKKDSFCLSWDTNHRVTFRRELYLKCCSINSLVARCRVHHLPLLSILCLSLHCPLSIYIVNEWVKTCNHSLWHSHAEFFSVYLHWPFFSNIDQRFVFYQIIRRRLSYRLELIRLMSKFEMEYVNIELGRFVRTSIFLHSD